MITVNIEKAKVIAHDKRRASREAELAPYDSIIAKQIPGILATDAETARQAIRDKYAQMQSEVDAAQNADELISVLARYI